MLCSNEGPVQQSFSGIVSGSIGLFWVEKFLGTTPAFVIGNPLVRHVDGNDKTLPREMRIVYCYCW